MDEMRGIPYAGFWIRLAATVVDVALLLMVIVPLLWFVYGPDYFIVRGDILDGQLPLSVTVPFLRGPADFLISWVLPSVALFVFWRYRSATPGKLLFSLVIVDATTLRRPTPLQWVIRFFAYLVSTLPLFLGFLWIAFDPRKQGWHDKLARTVVIRQRT